ncbi:MAG: ATP-binding protein [Tepidisphaeraceae bacterium]|jgi:signal transduction histidine kinase
MTEALTIAPELRRQIDARADQLLIEYQNSQWKQTDHLFTILFILQWVACVAVAVWLSPLAWEGLESRIHPHIWAAVYLGGLIAACPIALVIVRPGEAITRYVISAAQVMHSALLIHLSGGRIETHFHVFGSLAFLSFYRDWRALLPATVLVAMDHAVRGIFWPESVFGIATVSYWRWMEHAGWVVFEDIILVWACVRGAKELATLATRQAELEATNQRVEAEVARQTARLESVSQELIGTARRAGMADIATGVLHNVGNVLNTVNISASVALNRLKDSEVPSLVKVGEMLQTNHTNLPAFLTTDERGKHLPAFLIELSECLSREHAGLIDELHTVATGLDHIKEIVSAQQQHAKSGSARVKVSPAELFEKAIGMDLGVSTSENLTIVRDFPQIAPVVLDRHKVLQILINLLSNAKKAVIASSCPEKRIELSTRKIDSGDKSAIRFQVRDNGVGIHPDNLAKIFAHGFTTHAEGHGFGLHSAANAAGEMGGKLTVASDGLDRGATFTLELPLAGLSSVEQLLFDRKETSCQPK